jgi:tRNA A-37 threonylcarbamoyl transferase component Bud32
LATVGSSETFKYIKSNIAARYEWVRRFSQLTTDRLKLLRNKGENVQKLHKADVSHEHLLLLVTEGEELAIAG